jgi:hypothetical protein
MNTITTLIAIIPVLACQAAVIPPKAPAPGAVYIVTRAASAEARALFSARLVKLNAANLHWYEDANVVRAEVPKKSLAAVRADREVVLVRAFCSNPRPPCSRYLRRCRCSKPDAPPPSRPSNSASFRRFPARSSHRHGPHGRTARNGHGTWHGDGLDGFARRRSRDAASQ